MPQKHIFCVIVKKQSGLAPGMGQNKAELALSHRGRYLKIRAARQVPRHPKPLHSRKGPTQTASAFLIIAERKLHESAQSNDGDSSQRMML